MSDVVLNLLKLCLLALIYLFLARVVWVVGRELRAEPITSGPAPAPARAERRRRRGRPEPTATATGARRVAVRHADGRAEECAIVGPATIGRGAGCTIVLTDTFASQVHARLTPSDTGLRIEDLGSTNGTVVNGAAVTGTTALRPGDNVRIGQSTIEVLA